MYQHQASITGNDGGISLKRKKHVSKTGTKKCNNYIPIKKHLKWKRIKCFNQKIEWLNGYENKTPTHAAYKRLTSD